MNIDDSEFKKIFRGLPSAYLILRPDLTIVTATDAYLAATKTKLEEIVGKGVFEVFPESKETLDAHGMSKLTLSFNIVLEQKVPHVLNLLKYDLPLPDEEGGGFETKYWRPSNSPIFDEQGNVAYIANHVEDITHMVDVLNDSYSGVTRPQELPQ